MKFTTFVIASATLSLSSGMAQAAGIEGDYTLKGKSANGSSYAGKLRVSAAGPVYRLSYQDNRTLRGMGVQRGNNLFAAWGPNDACTVSALEIRSDGSLEGPWGDLSHNKLGTETLKRQSGAPSDVAGTYASSGLDPDGNAYQGITTIEARGAIYKVVFKGGGENYEGVAVKHAGYLAVSYGGEKCGVTAYGIRPDNTMSGIYAEYGTSGTGTEEMVKGW